MSHKKCYRTKITIIQTRNTFIIISKTPILGEYGLCVNVALLQESMPDLGLEC